MHPLKLVQIKNPFGILQTNPKMPREWVGNFDLKKKRVWLGRDTLVFNNSVVMEELILMLEPESLLHLIHSEILSKKVLQKSLTVRAWKEIIKHIELYRSWV